MGAVATPTSWTSGTPEGEACTHKLGGGSGTAQRATWGQWQPVTPRATPQMPGTLSFPGRKGYSLYPGGHG